MCECVCVFVCVIVCVCVCECVCACMNTCVKCTHFTHEFSFACVKCVCSIA